jgi:putative sigma-54 modulation protein
MNKRCHQRMDAYFKDEAPDATVITVRVTEQKSTYKVEMTMPYLGHTLRTENQEREISLPALDKGIDILERQMKKLRTRLGRDLRKKPAVAEEAPAIAEEEAIEEQEKVIRVKRYAAKPMSVDDAILEMDLLGHSFYMFNNIESGNAATVYRRTDGGCGLIELENL